MASDVLRERVASLTGRLTPAYVEREVRALLAEGEDIGGGVNAMRLIRHWLGDVAPDNAHLQWAYARLKPALRVALDALPALYYFEGD
ncbi:MAG: hypothetical protein JXA09_09985 [Anaerolineae bacterium]|nr:hypothetical protein [Anaerolineae bacterium]